MGVINGDGAPLPGQQMGLPTSAWYGTGMAGSQSTGAMESAPLATVAIVPVYQSSQGDPDRVTVGVGDTFSSSSDHAAADSPLLPGGAGTAVATGMGGGSYGSNHSRPRP
jgi:hypothetical protein